MAQNPFLPCYNRAQINLGGSKMAFCANCGNKVGENDKFCASCGTTRVPGAPAVQPEPPPPPPVYQAAPVQPQAPPQSAYNAPAGGYQQPLGATTSGESSTGLSANVAALIAYFGWWVTGIIFLILEKKSQFVRFHAAQSIVVFGAISIINVILSVAFSRFWVLSGLLSGVLWIAGFALWVLLMYKAYRGETYKLPIAGDIANSITRKI
jgi:uncharacterized membrane protein